MEYSQSKHTQSNLESEPMSDLRQAQIKHTYDAKTNPDGIVNLSSAKNDLMQNDLQKWFKRETKMQDVQKCLSNGDLIATELNIATASFANRYFEPFRTLTVDNVIASHSIASLLERILFSIADKGDAVVVSALDLDLVAHHLPLHNDFEIIRVPCSKAPGGSTVSGGSSELVQRVSDAVNAAKEGDGRVAAIFVANSLHAHGNIQGTIKELAEYAFETGLQLIVVDASIWTMGTSSSSVLSLDLSPEVWENVHVVWNMGEDLAVVGSGMSFLFTYSNRFHSLVSASDSSAMQANFNALVSTKLLADSKFLKDYIPRYQQRVKQNCQRVKKFLRDYDVAFSTPPTGFSLALDLSEWLGYFSTEPSPQLGLLKYLVDRGVFLEPGTGLGTFVLSYTTMAMEVGVKRLVTTLGELDGTMTPGEVVNRYTAGGRDLAKLKYSFLVQYQ